METIEYRTADKSTWGPGPWQDEPDKRQWQDPETGLACLLVRNGKGALCGYVGVTEGHPWYGKGYDDDEVSDVDVHGGLTFSGSCREGDETKAICHKPAPGEPDNVWWFGFDCCHGFDLSPAYNGRHGFSCSEEQYRTVAYATRHCANLAERLMEVST